MPQAVAAAVTWVATAVASTVSVGLAAAGLGGVAASWAVVATYTVSELALYAGLAYAVDSVSRPRQKPIGSELTFNMDPAYPREMVVGEQLIGGSMVARFSNGSNRKQAHFVIQVADHPCVALNAVYGDQRLQWSTPLVHGVKTEITSYSNSGGARVWMTWHDGRPGQTADSNLITASSTDPEVVAGRMPAWTSNHKGAGCAYVYVEVWYDSDILTSIPSWLFQVQGAEFYDRRKDTTAGGSGSHRLDDPSTWEYTTNAAVVWDHWSLGYKVEDDDLAFGLGLSPTELPYAQFAAQADLCDEDVETGTGGDVETIKRYAITGVLSTATFFEEQLEDFQIQMAGRFVDLGGRIGFLGGEERSVAVSLTSGDLWRGEALQYADKLGFDELYGRVNGNFRDPANLYQATPYQEQVTAYAQLPDGGEAQSVNLDMPLEIHPRRAARLASAWLARESLQPRLVAVFRPKAWKLEPGDWFEYTDTGLQIDAATFEVVDIAKADNFSVTLTARAIDPNFLAFDTDNDPDLSVPPDVPPVDLFLDTPSGVVAAITITGGGATEPAIRFTLSTIDAAARELALEVQMWNGSSLTGDPIPATGHSDQGTILIRQGILPDKQYKVRVKCRAGKKESLWSAWSSAITTSTTYTVPGSSLASAIVGQGDLATADQADLPLSAGVNLLANASLQDVALAGGAGLLPTNWSRFASSGTAATYMGVTGSGLNPTYPPAGERAFDFARAGAPGGSYYEWNSDAIPVEAGKYYVASVYAAPLNSTGSLYIQWFDSSGTFITLSALADSLAGAAPAGKLSDYQRISKTMQAPTGAVTAKLYLQVNNNASNGSYTTFCACSFLRPMFEEAQNGAASIPSPWARGVGLIETRMPAERGADVTSTNTAAAITSQGALATLNSVGSGEIGTNAVTQGSIQENDSAVTLTTSYQDLASVTLTVPDSDTLVKVDWSLYLDSANYDTAVDNEVYLEITRTIGAGSPTQIFESFIGGNPAALHYEISGGTESFDVPCIFVGIKSGFDTDQPGAGSITYKIRGKKTGSGSAACDVSKRRLFGMMFKR